MITCNNSNTETNDETMKRIQKGMTIVAGSSDNGIIQLLIVKLMKICYNLLDSINKNYDFTIHSFYFF